MELMILYNQYLILEIIIPNTWMIQKKNIHQMINSLNLEKGNFIFENESLPEIIFIEKNDNQTLLT